MGTGEEPLRRRFCRGPAVAWCSGSAVIVTGGTNTAASAAGGKRGGNNGGPPTGGTAKPGGTARSPRPVIQKKEENGEKYVTATTEAEFHEALNRGFAVEVTWELGERIGLMVEDVSGAIDWTAPRLLCIAGGFTRYDEHAVQQMNRNIELIRYRRFGANLLMLELVTAISAESGPSIAGATDSSASNQKTISDTLAALDGSLQDLYQSLRTHLMALGDDVQEKTLKFYVAFKRLRNFARVKVYPSKAAVSVYLNVNPDTITLEKGFTRDFRKVARAGDLEVTIRTWEDLERAKPLLQTSYEAS